MKSKKVILTYYKHLILFAFVVFVVSCVEEIPIEPEGFEKAIIIESTLTNEIKQHRVKLSQAFAVDTTGPSALSGANVKISGNEEYIFEETESGIYISRDSFAAKPEIDYRLYVSINGKEYESKAMQLPKSKEIDAVKASRIDYNGKDGIAITLDQKNSQGEASYYRYEFEETFKFNSPMFKSKDLILVDGFPVEVFKTKEEYTCYRTEKSQKITLANTNSLSEDHVNNLLLTFIEAEDPKIARRYSILVKQYVINRGAYTYYKNLKEISGTDNIFSLTQPGFFAGNIENKDNPEEKIVGYFEVSSVTEKRMFFSYEDFFNPENERSTLVSYCPVETPPLPVLVRQIKEGTIKWFATPLPQATPYTSFKVVPAACVDCTVLGSNKIPDFWEE